MLMKTLYIIGNGFDLHHRLDTSYKSFGLFLKAEYSTLYDQLLEFFGLPDLSVSDFDVDPLWKDFEHSLSLLDVDTVFDEHSNYLANPSSSGFRDRDWHAFEIEMERVVDDLTSKLFEAFRKFILNVKYPSPCNIEGALSLNRHSHYLSFNYTNTLQKYYSIPNAQITYIHGEARDNEIILGHGVDPQSFVPKEPIAPEGLNDEEYERWYEYMSDQYDYSFESGKSALQTYFSKSFKSTQDIIISYTDFFEAASNVEQVYILGHSLSDVDLPYFKKIFSSARNLKNITVTYYSDWEFLSHKKTLIALGVSENKINLVKINSLKKPSLWSYLIQSIFNFINNRKNV